MITPTRGGRAGHLARRVIHVGMIIFPWLYYRFGEAVAGFFHFSPQQLLWTLFFLVIGLESLRLLVGFQAFGQREHEIKQISSFAWGTLSLLLVLLFASSEFAYPIIASCALGDPLMGELRRFRVAWWWVMLSGVLLIGLLWLLAAYYFSTPWWWALIMGPLIVVAEWPNLKWIDDNAMMQLVPLMLLKLANL